MAPKLSLKVGAALHGRLKLARLLAMPEEELAGMARNLEAEPLFARLTRAGALRLTPFPKAYFAARRFAGLRLTASESGLAEMLDGQSDLVRLMRRIGRKRFEESFLGEEGLSDSARSRRCGASVEEVRRLRAFIDRMYVRGELADKAAPVPAKCYSTVAGITLQEGEPALCFFNREIWKGRYRIDDAMLTSYLEGVDARERTPVRRYLSRLAFVDHRKTTLYKVLEALLRVQADYLKSGEPARRVPLTQKALGVAVGAEASVLNRLISNKAVELPWGMEAPLKTLFPRAKSLARATLAALAKAEPGLSDDGLRRALAGRHRIHLSRRSVAQYRRELGLGGKGRR